MWWNWLNKDCIMKFRVPLAVVVRHLSLPLVTECEIQGQNCQKLAGVSLASYSDNDALRLSRFCMSVQNGANSKESIRLLHLS